MFFHVLFLLFSLCQTAEPPKFYFLRAFDEISASKDVQDVLGKLNLFNEDSINVEINRTSIEPDTLKEYAQAQNQVVSFLYHSSELLALTMNQQETASFIMYLMISLEMNLDLFPKDGLMNIIGFIFAITKKSASTVATLNTIVHNLIPILNAQDRRMLCDVYIKHASLKNNCFLHAGMTTSKYLDTDSVKTFVDTFISQMFLNSPAEVVSKNLATLTTTLFIVCNSDIVFDDKTYESLLLAVKSAIHNNFEDSQNHIISTLNLFITKLSDKRALVHLLIDLLLSEHVTKFISKESLQLNYKEVMIKCIDADRLYFKDAIETTSADMEVYKTFAKKYSMVSLCLSHIKFLSEKSSESQFRLALSSSKKLLQLQRANDLDFPIITKFFDDLNEFVSSLTRVTNKHKNNHPGRLSCLHLIVYLSLVSIERLKGQTIPYWICCHIAYCVGHLLLPAVRKQFNYPTELVNDVMPLINTIFDGLQNLDTKMTKPMTPVNLAAYLHFIKLHPTPEIIQPTTDKLCVNMIISAPLSEQTYTYIEGIEFTSESAISVKSFLHFLEKLVESPKKNQDDVKHLNDFFNYLIVKSFLSKTEKLAFKRILNNFK